MGAEASFGSALFRPRRAPFDSTHRSETSGSKTQGKQGKQDKS